MPAHAPVVVVAAPTGLPMRPVQQQWLARAVLSGLLLLAVAAASQPVTTSQKTTRSDWSDPQTFDAVVKRIVGGASYYEAMGAELRAGNYPVRSVFNWRLPTLYAAFAHGGVVTRVVLFALLGAVLLATIELSNRLPLAALMTIVALELGAIIAPLTSLGRLFAEAWAGLLLALAVLAYARRWHTAGAILVLAGLFVRELVAPFALVCGVMAITGRRWREASVWAIGLLSFLAYYAYHVHMIQNQILATDLAYTSAWIQFGGLRFILSAIRFGSWFPLAAAWIVALACTLVAASFWSSAPRHLKACVATYLAFFAIIGQPVNSYWGLLVAPTWALAIGYGLLGVRQLWTKAAGIQIRRPSDYKLLHDRAASTRGAR